MTVATTISQGSSATIKEVFDEIKEKIEQVDSAGRKRKASIYWELLMMLLRRY
jgi:hypothetical protein